MNRWRTRPQTVMTAKSQHSSSHHLPTIRSTAIRQLRIGIRSVSSLGEKSQRGSSSPRGSCWGPRATERLCGPERGSEPERQLLGDLALDHGVRSDYGQRGDEDDGDRRPARHEPRTRVTNESRQPGQPDRERDENHLGPRQIAELPRSDPQPSANRKSSRASRSPPARARGTCT